MVNALGYYNPVFYANEALIQLEKALGMAARVYRGYELERNSFSRGETINIRRPGTFTAQDAPSTAQDLAPDSEQITLAHWREVKFKLNDKELAFTGQRIVDEHIRPAAVALADDVDSKLNALYKDIPAYHNFSAPAVISDLTAARKLLFNNKVPMTPGMVHFEVDGNIEAELLNLSAFSQHQGAGDLGVATQLRGTLGTRFGMEFFANQNVATHDGNAVADGVGAINNGAGYVAGTKSIAVDGMTAAGAFKAGDIVEITGHTQKYVLTADVTMSTGAGTLAIEPGLESAVTDDQVVTVISTALAENLVFHRNAFALVMAPLPDHASDIGVRVATVRDPITGLSIRSRVYYVGDSSEMHVALDILYGVKTLDRQMAARIRD